MIGKTLFFCYIFFMKSKEQTIVPQLPNFAEEISHSERFLSLHTDKKEDLLILFFTLLYKNQNNNAAAVYNFLFSLLEKILPKPEAYTLAKFHFSLTRPPEKEKFLPAFLESFSEQEKHILFTELDKSALFTSPDNQRLLHALHNDAKKDTKHKLPKYLAISKEQFSDLSKQIKQHIPIKSKTFQNAAHPLSNFQQNVQNLFLPFFLLIKIWNRNLPIF